MSDHLFTKEGADRREDRARRRAIQDAAADLLLACKLTEEATQHSMRCETCEAFFAGMGQRCPIMADLTKRARETRRAAIARAESLPPAPELDPGDRT